jgi:hypothetical protein
MLGGGLRFALAARFAAALAITLTVRHRFK